MDFGYKSGGFPERNQTGRGLVTNKQNDEGHEGERERENCSL